LVNSLRGSDDLALIVFLSLFLTVSHHHVAGFLSFGQGKEWSNIEFLSITVSHHHIAGFLSCAEGKE
jgi:hypothetical protein